MRAVRQIHRFAIVRRRPSAIGYATAVDLDFAPDVSPPAPGECSLIHAADLVRERALFTLHTPEGAKAALDSAFLYAAALDHATGIASVPFERLNEQVPGGRSAKAAKPVFLFSIGRTGSTLLVRLLQAAGCQAISENDWFTTLCRMGAAAQDALGKPMLASMAAAGVASLSASPGSRPFIKLRSQCNEGPEVLLEALPAARAVLMLRGHRSWALSRGRVFGEPPEQVADMLRQGIVAFHRLAAIGHTPQIVWFEDMVADPAAVVRALSPGLVLDDAASARLDAVLGRDSQEGTSLARGSVAVGGEDQAFLAAFEESWAAIRPRAIHSPETSALIEAIEAN